MTLTPCPRHEVQVVTDPFLPPRPSHGLQMTDFDSASFWTLPLYKSSSETEIRCRRSLPFRGPWGREPIGQLGVSHGIQLTHCHLHRHQRIHHLHRTTKRTSPGDPYLHPLPCLLPLQDQLYQLGRRPLACCRRIGPRSWGISMVEGGKCGEKLTRGSIP